MGKTIAQLGDEMSAFELSVFWPAYFDTEAYIDAKAAKKR